MYSYHKRAPSHALSAEGRLLVCTFDLSRSTLLIQTNGSPEFHFGGHTYAAHIPQSLVSIIPGSREIFGSQYLRAGRHNQGQLQYACCMGGGHREGHEATEWQFYAYTQSRVYRLHECSRNSLYYWNFLRFSSHRGVAEMLCTVGHAEGFWER